MQLIRTALVLAVMTGSVSGATFFNDLEEAYLTAFERTVRTSASNTNVYSISISADRFRSGRFQPLPLPFWKKLRSRLEAKGVNVTSYVPSDELEWRDGRPGMQLVSKATGRPAWIYAITGVHWYGGERLLISQYLTQGAMSSIGNTLVLEMKGGQWTVVGTTGDWGS